MPMMIAAMRPGGPEVLTWREEPMATPGPGEVLIKQTKIGLNFLDIYMTSGVYPFPDNGFLVPGSEASGEVVEVGAGVEGITVGDRVAYVIQGGAYRQYRLAAADRIVKLPASISDDMAAASMLKGMTVEYLVNRSARLEPGDTVLFHAAAGGVGLIAGQWLASMGVNAIGTAGGAEKVALAKQAGYSHVIDYNSEDFVEVVRELTSGKGVKVVYDSVGKATYPHSLACLQRFGLFVSFGQSSGMIDNFRFADLAKNGSLYAQRPTLFNYISSREELARTAGNLFDKLADGTVTLKINQRYPLQEAAAAFTALEQRKTTGITLLETGI